MPSGMGSECAALHPTLNGPRLLNTESSCAPVIVLLGTGASIWRACLPAATLALSWLASRPPWARSQVSVKCRGLSATAVGHAFELLCLLAFHSNLCSRELSLASKWPFSESLTPTGWPTVQSCPNPDHPESASDSTGLRCQSEVWVPSRLHSCLAWRQMRGLPQCPLHVQ